MICMLCDHTANTTGCFWGFASFQVSAYIVPICLYARVFKALDRFSLLRTWNRSFTCAWTRAGFWGCLGCWQTASHIFPLTVRRRGSLGPAAVCSATGITGGLWSHRAAALFAGKEQDDVMLSARHQHALIGCTMEEGGWNQCNNNTLHCDFMRHHQFYHKHDYWDTHHHTLSLYIHTADVSIYPCISLNWS